MNNGQKIYLFKPPMIRWYHYIFLFFVKAGYYEEDGKIIKYKKFNGKIYILGETGKNIY